MDEKPKNTDRELEELPREIMLTLEKYYYEWDDLTLQNVRDCIEEVTGQKLPTTQLDSHNVSFLCS